ncbi:dipeptidyl aminopeptidase/acylaminoacyl peptidase [Sphingobium xanthum]|uniref:Atxe2 family lasso peptide isopeptidase n=1 Tax=Sphingobium xanthum TaxID=1387165 RepID=UPI001C8B1F0E|nr:Atxe2 family lasso peptide isopeptidase [Sphingobium xanthum]
MPFFVAGVMSLCPSPVRAAASCQDILVEREPATTSRHVTTSDLVKLRDVGFSQQQPQDSSLGISPDGGKLAFIVTQGDARSNSYCQALVVMEVRSHAKPTILDVGGDLILEPIALRGLRTDYGLPATIRPLWSPDGQWLAYLKRENGRIQVWRADVAARSSRPVTHSDFDVDVFAWSRDGSTIVFATRTALRMAEAAIEQEGRNGFLFDDRIVPYASSRPQIRLPVPFDYHAVDLRSGDLRQATAAERGLLAPGQPVGSKQAALLLAQTGNGKEAWTKRRENDRLLSPVDLWVTNDEGKEFRCSDPACTGNGIDHGVLAMWWMPDGHDLLFLRRGGWGHSETTLYRWKLGHKPRLLLSTTDILIGCQLAGAQLVCARESSTQPRRLILIDSGTGRSTPIFDPNPEFASKGLGKIERLHWRNELGLECYGDLVLPPDYQSGQKLPLIVVQYLTRGFLRGGTGDEVPIFAFADRGYAVLSVNNPPPFFTTGQGSNLQSMRDATALNSRDWAERRNVHSSLMTGIDLVIARGLVDPTKIGITGLSDGSTTVQYALINAPDRFAAASVSACCVEPTGMMIYGGIALAEDRRRMSFPPARGTRLEDWKPLSVALNASRIKAPLLMQLPDHGYLLGVDIFMALREEKKPVEMFVFPDEYHLKWQPAHRQAIYDRNLDWFDFWLLGREDPDPAKAEQYRRWQQLRVDGQPQRAGA